MVVVVVLLARCRSVSIAVWGDGAGLGLGLCVLRLTALAEERRQCDRGKDADDQNDDEKLDQCEALLTLSSALRSL